MPESQDALTLQRRARRRLVGAIALVLFVVIALPMVFDQEPRPITQDLVIEIPSQDAGKFQPKVEPRPAAVPDAAPASDAKAAEIRAGDDAGAAKAEQAAKPVEATKAETRKAEAPKSEANKAEPRVGTAAAEPAKDKPQAQAPKDEAGKTKDVAEFVVPLGAFSNPANAKQVQSKVSAAGFKSYAEKFSGPHGSQLRVRAGPFASREAAERARERLKSLGLSPVGAVTARDQS